MKQYLSIILVVVCVLLAIGLVVTKHGASADLDAAAGTIVDFSNRLDTAQAEITARGGNIYTLSNSLAECATTALTFSNQLTEGQATISLQTGQIANLSGQVTAVTADNQALSASLMEATNQLTTLTGQLTRTVASLTQTNLELVQVRKDDALLQNRLQRDVAERLVILRKFNNPEALQAQMNKLKEYGGSLDVSADKIYSGLDMEVRSNGTVHVIAPE